MVDFNAQLFIDLFLCILGFATLLVFISIPILVIVLLVKLIKNQNKQSQIYEDAQKGSR